MAPKCIEGGWLVGPDTLLPDDPKIYYHDPQSFPIGCSRIWCDACHQFVRQWAGYRLAQGAWSLSPADHEELFEIRNPDQSRLLAKSKEYRVYTCQCWADSLTSSWSLGRDYLDWGHWFCAGHPQ